MSGAVLVSLTTSARRDLLHTFPIHGGEASRLTLARKIERGPTFARADGDALGLELLLAESARSHGHEEKPTR
jgi:hypothetical protein